MRMIRKASFAQRVVLSVGSGLALAVAAGWWLLSDAYAVGGWFAYAPGTSTDQYFAIQDRQPMHLLVALAAVVLWTVISLLLFGPRAQTLPSDTNA